MLLRRRHRDFVMAACLAGSAGCADSPVRVGATAEAELVGPCGNRFELGAIDTSAFSAWTVASGPKGIVATSFFSGFAKEIGLDAQACQGPTLAVPKSIAAAGLAAIGCDGEIAVSALKLSPSNLLMHKATGDWVDLSTECTTVATANKGHAVRCDRVAGLVVAGDCSIYLATPARGKVHHLSRTGEPLAEVLPKLHCAPEEYCAAQEAQDFDFSPGKQVLAEHPLGLLVVETNDNLVWLVDREGSKVRRFAGLGLAAGPSTCSQTQRYQVPSSGPVATVPLCAPSAVAATTGGAVFIATLAGGVYRVRDGWVNLVLTRSGLVGGPLLAKNPALVELFLPGPETLAAGPDGTLWLAPARTASGVVGVLGAATMVPVQP